MCCLPAAVVRGHCRRVRTWHAHGTRHTLPHPPPLTPSRLSVPLPLPTLTLPSQYPSFHKYGDFFPGTGALGDTGHAEGKLYSVNVPLQVGCGWVGLLGCGWGCSACCAATRGEHAGKRLQPTALRASPPAATSEPAHSPAPTPRCACRRRAWTTSRTSMCMSP